MHSAGTRRRPLGMTLITGFYAIWCCGSILIWSAIGLGFFETPVELRQVFRLGLVGWVLYAITVSLFITGLWSLFQLQQRAVP